MARYAITYRETYTKTYYVEADTYEEGCEKIREAIMNDEVDAPEECWDSEYEDVTKYHLEDLKNDDYLDVK